MKREGSHATHWWCDRCDSGPTVLKKYSVCARCGHSQSSCCRSEPLEWFHESNDSEPEDAVENKNVASKTSQPKLLEPVGSSFVKLGKIKSKEQIQWMLLDPKSR